MSTHYAVLSVDRNATTAEIKKAYRATMLKNHPDKTRHLSAPLQALGERISKAANNAYEILSDPRARQDYDLCLPPPRALSRRRKPAEPYVFPEPVFPSPLWYRMYEPSPLMPQPFNAAWYEDWFKYCESHGSEESQSSDVPEQDGYASMRNKNPRREAPKVGTRPRFTEWPSFTESVGGRRRGWVVE